MGLFSKRSPFEQHVAVFGESGSGKTTLVSVFYGYQQAADFSKRSGYNLLASDTTQGQQLLKTYHRIEDNCLPPQTRYHQTVFTFQVRPNGLRKDAGRLVWHDYPGEWWSETRIGEEEHRKQEAFKSLLCSDTALFLVDGQRLKDNHEHYLPRLFKSFRDEISRQREFLIKGGTLLNTFPRVWIICLSKADLFPDKNVEWFRAEVMKKACEEVGALREEIRSMVTQPEFVSLGEDYLLVSSAKFDPETRRVLDPKNKIGIELIAPLILTTPLHYAKKWAGIEIGSKKTAAIFTEAFRGLTTNWLKWIPIVGRFFQLLDEELKGGVGKLRQIHERAVEKGNAVDAVLAAFAICLRKPGTEKIFLSPTEVSHFFEDRQSTCNDRHYKQAFEGIHNMM
uniref:Double-GTPase 2 domain-containing protein n=1 Tax=Desulfatirhabdium butyrativorans TaxID=340467 RepID=A0A7C4VR66_9BACT